VCLKVFFLPSHCLYQCLFGFLHLPLHGGIPASIQQRQSRTRSRIEIFVSSQIIRAAATYRYSVERHPLRVQNIGRNPYLQVIGDNVRWKTAKANMHDGMACAVQESGTYKMASRCKDSIKGLKENRPGTRRGSKHNEGSSIASPPLPVSILDFLRVHHHQLLLGHLPFLHLSCLAYRPLVFQEEGRGHG
jgi:hypothetical protein